QHCFKRVSEILLWVPVSFFGRFLYDCVVSCRQFRHCFECVLGFLVINFVLGTLSVFLGLCVSSWLSLLGSLCEFVVVSFWVSVRVRGCLFLGLCASSWLSFLGSLCEFVVVSSWISV